MTRSYLIFSDEMRAFASAEYPAADTVDQCWSRRDEGDRSWKGGDLPPQR